MKKMKHLILLVVALMMSSAFVGNAHCLDPDALFEKLKALDAVYASGLSVTGTNIKAARPMEEGIPEFKMRWRLTLAGKRKALVLEASEIPVLPVRSDGNERTAFWIKNTIFFGTDLSGSSRVSGVFKPNAGKQPILTNRDRIITLFPPDSPALNRYFRQIMRTLGRGFTDWAVAVSEAHEGDDGLIAATIESHEWGQGRWDVIVDQEAAYMVREAKFFRSGETEPLFVVSNSGSVQTDEGGFVPAEGRWSDRTSHGIVAEIPYTFDSARLTTDDELLETAARRMKIGEFDDLHVLLNDYRLKPQAAFEKFPGGEVREIPNQ